MTRALLAVALLAAAAAADDKPAAKDAGFVKLVQVGTGKVLSVEPPKDEDEPLGTRAVVAKDDPKDQSQQWAVQKEKEHFRLVNRKTKQVLDVSNESDEENAPIIQWEDNGFPNQLWAWAGAGDERRLKSKSSGLVVDTDKDGKLVQRKPAEASKSQLWKVVPVGK